MDDDRRNDLQIASWLLLCCVLVFAMVVVGGLTRLTGSGLSIVEWAPLMGILPPLSQEAWAETFAKYQRFPEFQMINFDMTLEEFKGIFWLEYWHRVLGRTIGVVFFVPYVFFILRKKVKPGLPVKLFIAFILGGLQGLLGWYMVKSGLVKDPHVSQYRLTAHLFAAFIIYAYMFWLALSLIFGDGETPAEGESLKGFSWLLTGVISLTVISGGLVAGLKAGLAYNTFPLMNGRLVPEDFFLLDPAWINFFDNIATVQWDHRLLATVVFSLVVFFWSKGRKSSLARVRLGSHLLLGMAIVQVTLGITTLLFFVPVPLASAHQAGAMLLFTIALFLNHVLQKA